MPSSTDSSADSSASVLCARHSTTTTTVCLVTLGLGVGCVGGWWWWSVHRRNNCRPESSTSSTFPSSTLSTPSSSTTSSSPSSSSSSSASSSLTTVLQRRQSAERCVMSAIRTAMKSVVSRRVNQWADHVVRQQTRRQPQESVTVMLSAHQWHDELRRVTEQLHSDKGSSSGWCLSASGRLTPVESVSNPVSQSLHMVYSTVFQGIRAVWHPLQQVALSSTSPTPSAIANAPLTTTTSSPSTTTCPPHIASVSIRIPIFLRRPTNDGYLVLDEWVDVDAKWLAPTPPERSPSPTEPLETRCVLESQCVHSVFVEHLCAEHDIYRHATPHVLHEALQCRVRVSEAMYAYRSVIDWDTVYRVAGHLCGRILARNGTDTTSLNELRQDMFGWCTQKPGAENDPHLSDRVTVALWTDEATTPPDSPPTTPAARPRLTSPDTHPYHSPTPSHTHTHTHIHYTGVLWGCTEYTTPPTPSTPSTPSDTLPPSRWAWCTALRETFPDSTLTIVEPSSRPLGVGDRVYWMMVVADTDTGGGGPSATSTEHNEGTDWSTPVRAFCESFSSTASTTSSTTSSTRLSVRHEARICTKEEGRDVGHQTGVCAVEVC